MTNHPPGPPRWADGAGDRLLVAVAAGVAVGGFVVIIVEEWLPIHLTRSERLILLITAVLLGLLTASVWSWWRHSDRPDRG